MLTGFKFGSIAPSHRGEKPKNLVVETMSSVSIESDFQHKEYCRLDKTLRNYNVPTDLCNTQVKNLDKPDPRWPRSKAEWQTMKNLDKNKTLNSVDLSLLSSMRLVAANIGGVVAVETTDFTKDAGDQENTGKHDTAFVDTQTS